MPNLIDTYKLDQFNDTFALGHYARVMDAQDRRNGQSVAFKLLRPEHVSQDGEQKWEYRAFANEADLLMKVAGNPDVISERIKRAIQQHKPHISSCSDFSEHSLRRSFPSIFTLSEALFSLLLVYDSPEEAFFPIPYSLARRKQRAISETHQCFL